MARCQLWQPCQKWVLRLVDVGFFVSTWPSHATRMALRKIKPTSRVFSHKFCVAAAADSTRNNDIRPSSIGTRAISHAPIGARPGVAFLYGRVVVPGSGVRWDASHFFVRSW